MVLMKYCWKPWVCAWVQMKNATPKTTPASERMSERLRAVVNRQAMCRAGPRPGGGGRARGGRLAAGGAADAGAGRGGSARAVAPSVEKGVDMPFYRCFGLIPSGLLVMLTSTARTRSPARRRSWSETLTRSPSLRPASTSTASELR